ncbi:hypothetical protein RJG79_00650 [Mycoplasmatota bacterium WC44]
MEILEIKEIRNFVTLGYNEKVLRKSLITDSRANEVGLEMPSISAVKGDSLLDFILFKNSANYFPQYKSKEKLNLLRTRYCGNTNLTFLMKEIGFYEKVDYGNNLSSLTDQTAATCFEAFLFNLFLEEGIQSVENFLVQIDFYNSYSRHNENKDLSNIELLDVVVEGINNINNVEYLDISKSTTYFSKVYEIFEECVSSVSQYNGGSDYNDLAEIVEFVGSIYSIERINGKTQGKYICKFRYLLSDIYNIISKIYELNKKQTRIIVNDGQIHINKDIFITYRDKYFLEFLHELKDKLE